MATANERQIGGDHYKGAEYQHWDWANDVKLHYLAGCASKYVSRHRNKNGSEDLQKALHYCDKAEELGVAGSTVMNRMRFFWKFVHENRMTMVETIACWYIMEGQWEAARLTIKQLFAGDR